MLPKFCRPALINVWQKNPLLTSIKTLVNSLTKRLSSFAIDVTTVDQRSRNAETVWATFFFLTGGLWSPKKSTCGDKPTSFVVGTCWPFLVVRSSFQYRLRSALRNVSSSAITNYYHGRTTFKKGNESYAPSNYQLHSV